MRSPAEFDYASIRSRSQRWLQESHASWAGEWLYTRIEPRYLVEPFIGEIASLPHDFKLFVFNGRVELIEVDTDRETSHKRTFYDRNWHRQEFSLCYPLDVRPIPRPTSLTQIIELAEILSEDFRFVRIDFYEIDGRPRFGEMTFYPDSGIGRFDPEDVDDRLGTLWS